MSHTPGPWSYEPHAQWWLRAADGSTIFHIDEYGNEMPGEANARLIAAAPALLEALKDLVALVDRRRRGFDSEITVGELTAQLVGRADAAIAKVEGRS